jgi:NADPH-dependent ferric siderophore reductase
MPKSPRAPRPAHSATVTETSQLSRDMVRITLSVDTSAGFSFENLTETDHYVKLLFPPVGASYAWPFDPAAVREELPREEWPVMRTYTLRSWDAAAGTVDIDFVTHGDTGLAGPWATAAEPGDQIGFMGPGGAWHPEGNVVFAGDEAAAPAIFAGIEAMPQDATATAFVEVADADSHLDAPVASRTDSALGGAQRCHPRHRAGSRGEGDRTPCARNEVVHPRCRGDDP